MGRSRSIGRWRSTRRRLRLSRSEFDWKENIYDNYWRSHLLGSDFFVNSIFNDCFRKHRSQYNQDVHMKRMMMICIGLTPRVRGRPCLQSVRKRNSKTRSVSSLSAGCALPVKLLPSYFKSLPSQNLSSVQFLSWFSDHRLVFNFRPSQRSTRLSRRKSVRLTKSSRMQATNFRGVSPPRRQCCAECQTSDQSEYEIIIIQF